MTFLSFFSDSELIIILRCIIVLITAVHLKFVVRNSAEVTPFIFIPRLLLPDINANHEHKFSQKHGIVKKFDFLNSSIPLKKFIGLKQFPEGPLLLFSSTLLWDHIKGFLVTMPAEEGQVQIRANAHKWSLLV